ncbi:CoA transferase [Candidatus Poriferisodalis sp.]|uniref:CoA transferase n=1 Tax=Candidatus Poriferisodalis sp. TaxID=3101277 RepID=UPI003B01E250
MSDWLPPGLFDYGAELATEADRRLGAGVAGDAACWIDMPRRLGTADEPSEPVRWGDGALCVDLGPDDSETWERFAEVHRDQADPDVVAAAAQEWRLPVTPFRRVSEAAVETAAPAPSCEPMGPASLDGKQIVDLTSMWAGPLCTELLGRAGAEVRKASSAARPDGLAGTAMYAELNAHKTAVELDPRFGADRDALERLLATADLLVTSLSPRALANLELLPEQLCVRHPRLHTLAITAFEPDSPECCWIAYGTGVHAASGLGWLGDEPQAPAYSYPDPLAGLLAARVAAEQIVGAAAQHMRVSLAGAVAPLAEWASCRRTAGALTTLARSPHDAPGPMAAAPSVDSATTPGSASGGGRHG